MPLELPRNDQPEDVPEIQGTQARVFEYVKKHPGTHVREIGRSLGLGIGDLQYHLYALEKGGTIKSIKHGFYRYVFPSGIFGDRQTAILSALSLESEREILLYLSQKPELTQLELARLTGLSPATLIWHMKRLKDQGIVERKKVGKTVSYCLVGDAEEVQRFIQNYHPVFWESWASRLADTFLSLSVREAEKEERGFDFQLSDVRNKRDRNEG